MFRLLKILLTPLSTQKKPPLVPPAEHSHEEERIALSASVTFDTEAFTHRTGYRIRDENYFIQAVVHRSYLQICPPGITQSNERMEFLGDAVLNLVVAEYLYHAFPDAEEGDLSKLRSRLVSRTALGECARRLQLQDFLLMSPSALQSVRSGSDSILVDAVEAFVAAIYLDGGYKASRHFIEDHLLKHISHARMAQDENYKSKLLEYSQARAMGIPRYVIVDESGPDHSPVFTVEVQVNGIPVGAGTGGNKKAAEQAAAAHALEHFRQTREGSAAS